MRFPSLGLLTLAGLAALAGCAAEPDAAAPGGVRADRPAAPAPSRPAPGDDGPAFQFADVAPESGLVVPHFNAADGRFRLVETMGSGVGLIDFDGDGWLDIYVAQGAPIPPVDPPDPAHVGRLYRNNRDGTFADVTESAGVGFGRFGQGVAVGDYDGDGLEDLFVSGLGGSALYRNRGDGTFEDATDSAGVRGSGWGSSCAFADLDGDGDLDLYVVRYLADTVDDRGRPTRNCNDATDGLGYCPPGAFRPEADLLYRNNGDGTFTDVSAEAGLADRPSNGLGLAIADLDGDGRLDVFVANDQMPNQLWRNLGGLRFEEVAPVWGLDVGETGDVRAGMGVALGDYDGDGLDDILVTNFFEEPNTLFRALRPGLYDVATPSARLQAPSRGMLGFGAGFRDFDNDGRLDLFVANGHINDVRVLKMPYEMPPQLFHNQGGRFAEVTGRAGPYFRGRWLGRAAAFGDLDNDGDVDVVVTHLGRPPALLRNDTGPAGHFLSLRLRGRGPARSPVGARVVAEVGGRTLARTVAGGTSYLAANDPRVHLGLGPARGVDRLEVRWPSGAVQVWTDLEADRFLEVVEGTEDPAPEPIAERDGP